MDHELFRKIRKIEIASRRPVNQLFAGEYRSVFKGQGLEFYEVREYQPGDDVRLIDRNVSARLGHPYIKKFVEERQRTIILMVDISASNDFGSLKKSKNEIAAELAAVLAFSAIKNNDLVGLLLFSGAVEKYIPPKKGRKHVLRLVREILNHKREDGGTDIAAALKYLSRVQRKSSIIFLISDLLDSGYEKAMLSASKKHDLISLIIKDRNEKELPRLPFTVNLEDPETGNVFPIDLSDETSVSRYRQIAESEFEGKKKYLHRVRSDFVEFSTDGNYIKPLNLFFRRREKRIKH
ncbi:MAG TPA: DUF58 domain-containing protein [Candidatus Omnitrophota bacterium]|nr:DUF58 domain-containing protein [Candidatus Omnitrophota bacterium]